MKAKSKFEQAIIKGLIESIAYERGEINLRTSNMELPLPPPEMSKEDIKKVRIKTLGVSQSIFAAILGIDASVLRSWEQGQKKPSGAAKRLLQLVSNEPGIVEKVTRIDPIQPARKIQKIPLRKRATG